MVAEIDEQFEDDFVEEDTVPNHDVPESFGVDDDAGHRGRGDCVTAVGGFREMVIDAMRGGRKSSLESLPDLSTEQKSFLKKLFPKGLDRSHFSQQNTGDCYSLAALHALKKHPIAPYLFCEIIKELPNGDWKVSFPKEGDVIVEKERLGGQIVPDKKRGGMVKKRSVNGQLGDQILNVAYAKIAKKWKVADNGGENSQVYTMIAVEGGWMDDPLKVFLGDNIVGNYYLGESKYSTFSGWKNRGDRKRLEKALQLYFYNPSRFILTTTTPISMKTKYKKHHGGEFDEEMYYMDPEYKFVQRHAYTIVSVDPYRRLVQVANPHDTKHKVFTLSYGDFFEYFSRVNVVEIDQNARYCTRAREVFDVELKPGVPFVYDISKQNVTLNLAKGCRIPVVYVKGKAVVKFPNGEKEVLKDGSVFVLGRDHDGPGSKRNISPMVSEIHAKLVYSDGVLSVTDLNSSNGTVVENGESQKNVDEDSEEGFDSGAQIMISRDQLIKNVEMNHHFGELEPRKMYFYSLNERVLVANLGKGSAKIKFRKGEGKDIELTNDGKKVFRLASGKSDVLGRTKFHEIGIGVSREHIRVTNTNGVLTIEDLDSLNGTSVDFE